MKLRASFLTSDWSRAFEHCGQAKDSASLLSTSAWRCCCQHLKQTSDACCSVATVVACGTLGNWFLATSSAQTEHSLRPIARFTFRRAFSFASSSMRRLLRGSVVMVLLSAGVEGADAMVGECDGGAVW